MGHQQFFSVVPWGMGYREYRPDPRLGFVECFWSIAEDSSGGVQEVWPDGRAELLFGLGNSFKVLADGGLEPFPEVCLVGLQTGVMRVYSEGPVRLLGVRCLPLIPLELDPDGLGDLHAEIKPLLHACEMEQAARTVETWLLRQPPRDERLRAALEHLYRSSGGLSLGELAGLSGTSARQVQRGFARRLGVSPKTLARLVRFASSWAALIEDPDASLADLAYRLGYADQAHLTHEFKRLGGQTPRAFADSVPGLRPGREPE